jgi:hypothetical protein
MQKDFQVRLVPLHFKQSYFADPTARSIPMKPRQVSSVPLTLRNVGGG